jgi:hypothetical protein
MDKLKQAINRYLDADTSRKQSAAKGAITRLINQRAEIVGAIAARSEVWEVLKDFTEIPRWMERRFTPGSLYTDGNSVFGWWDENLQVQAEELPLYHYGNNRGYEVCFYKQESLWKERGFEQAQKLPLVKSSNGVYVDFDIRHSTFFAALGYARPCPLQWRRINLGTESTLEVTRSILDQGFWKAYKWHENSKWWYLEHHPEWFSDSPIWGEQEDPDLPQPPSGAAILSPSSSLQKIEGYVKYLSSP